jgi:hypothetical protein
VAAFYSISNCEPGLRGVSLGNFLIKNVAEQLQARTAALKTFCTLSPIPGFAAWLLAGPGRLRCRVPASPRSTPCRPRTSAAGRDGRRPVAPAGAPSTSA